MPDVQTLKHFTGVEIKDAEKGEIEAKIATLEVVDKDGDIIRKGAHPKAAKVTMSSWGHDAVFGNRPAGKGTLVTEGDKLKFSGRVFLKTHDGRETFEVLKEMGPDQEWSFGFRVTGVEEPSDDERKAGAVRVITKMDAFEVSPVLLGAGIGTGTTSVKANDEQARAIAAAKAEQEKAIAEAKAEADHAILAAVAEQIAALKAKQEAEVAEQAAAEVKAAAEAEAARVAAAEEAERVRIAELATKEFDRFQRTMRRQSA